MSAGNTTQLVGLAVLMRMALSGTNPVPLSAQLLERAAADPNDANALLDISTILQLVGKRDLGLAMQNQALAVSRLYHLPPATGNAGVRLLAMFAPGDLMANTPLECLFEGSDVALDMLYLLPGAPLTEPLPDHDVLFIAIGESDRNRPLLADIGEAIEAWPHPVLNLPQRILNTSREGAYASLRDAPGMLMPATERIARAALELMARGELAPGDALDGGAFPIIVRPIDSHAGKDLEKLDAPAAIADYLSRVEQDEFYVSPFVDYRGTDGLYRKARLALVDGRPFACHLGISGHWMIHYLNAGMSESAEKRAEEQNFMDNFDVDFARRHASALQAIDERMGLDYLIIDCAETPDGKLLIFEVDTSAVVHAMDPVDMFPYKQPAMRKVFDAFRAMLDKAARRGTI
jgi:glutathione synthase/RimK-type ligase-like ATP-grasp enzyme